MAASLVYMLRLLRLPHMAVEDSIWWLAFLLSMLPNGRAMAVAGRRHHVLHAASSGSCLQSSSALLEALLCWASSNIASWAITASLRDDDHGPDRPPEERARAVHFVWRAWAKVPASSTVVRHGCMPSTLGRHSPCTAQTGLFVRC